MPFPASFFLHALDGEDGFRVAGLSELDQTGLMVSAAGDLNGDGIGDLVIGSPGRDAGFGDEGVAYVIFGRKTETAGDFLANFDLTTLDGTNGFRVITGGPVDHLGSALATGDINGDGVDDLIVGAPENDATPYDGGATYVIFGTASGFNASLDVEDLNGSNGFRVLGQAGQRLGAAVSTGDFNGDGISDLLMGAPGSGGHYVVFGKDTATDGAFGATLSVAALDGSSGFAISAGAAENTGHAAASAGDVNGDEIEDIVFGARGASPNGQGGAGAAYVLFGRSDFAAAVDLTALDGTDGFRMNGVAALEMAGFSVSSAGDINGDGFDDVAIGAPQTTHLGDYTGSVYIVFGRNTEAAGDFAATLELSSLDGTNGFRIDGPAGYGIAGWSVNKAGDVNGDGFDDLIVGAPGLSFGQGSTFVLFGKNTAADGGFGAAFNLGWVNGTNGFRMDGHLNGGFAGTSVSSAGDVDGDEVDDLIVGTRMTINGNESGAAFIVFGISDRVNFTGGAGDDVRDGGALADSLSGGGGKDVLSGLAGDDVIDGGDGNDQLFGGDGVDTLEGDGGGDILHGDGGADELGGGQGADKLFGGDGDDLLNGNDDNDRLEGGAGADYLYGGDGNDQLDGGGGLNTLEGGAGNDVFLVNNAGETLIELANGGYDIVRTSLDGWVLGDHFEAMQLQGSGDIDGSGNALSNNLQGNSGANTLDGAGGVDTLNGNDGDDIIIGGLGNDLLRGGTGADIFRVAHAFGPTLETDHIYDFSAAEGDILDLSEAYAGTLTLVAGFTKHAGEMTLTFAGGFTTLKLDVTGDGKVDYQMKINGDVTGESGGWLL